MFTENRQEISVLKRLIRDLHEFARFRIQGIRCVFPEYKYEFSPFESLVVFFRKILSIASGEKTQSEVNDYREIAIFKDGVTL